MPVLNTKENTLKPIKLMGKYPALESLIRSSGILCPACDGTGSALPPGLLLEKCEECNGTGYSKDTK